MKEYVERFRAGLPDQILNSMKDSFSVFLVPRVANRAGTASVAVEFVKIDEASPEDLERLDKLNVLIREKQIPIVNLGLYKPGEVVKELRTRIPHQVNPHVHLCAWRHYKVRPPGGDEHPQHTRPEYCVYDQTHEDYIYTKAWVDKLARDLADPEEYARVVGHPPLPGR